MYYLKSLKDKKKIISLIDYAKCTVQSPPIPNLISFSNLRIEWHFPNLIKTIYQKLTLYIILNWELWTVLLKNPNYWHH